MGWDIQTHPKPYNSVGVVGLISKCGLILLIAWSQESLYMDSIEQYMMMMCISYCSAVCSYIVQCAYSTVQCVLNTVQCVLNTVQCVLNTVQCVLNTVQCAYSIVQCVHT